MQPANTRVGGDGPRRAAVDPLPDVLGIQTDDLGVLGKRDVREPGRGVEWTEDLRRSGYPIVLAFAFDVEARVFEMLLDIAGVLFVADLKDHLNADAAQRCQPDRTLMRYLDHIGTRLGDEIQY